MPGTIVPSMRRRRPRHVINVNLELREQALCARQSRDVAKQAVAHIPRVIWNQLGFSKQTDEPVRYYLAVRLDDPYVCLGLTNDERPARWTIIEAQETSVDIPQTVKISLGPFPPAGFTDLLRRTHCKGLIQAANVVPLSTVIIQVPEESFEQIKSNRNYFDKLRQCRYILRENEFIQPLGVSCCISYCEPVKQGLLGVKTDIVIVLAKVAADDSPCDNQDEETEDDEVEFSGFLSQSLTRQGREPSDSSLLVDSITLSVSSLFSPLPDSFHQPPPPLVSDSESRIYMSVSYLAKLGCFSGDWIQIHTRAGKRRVVQIYALPSDMGKLDHAYMSPIQYCNLGTPCEITATQLQKNHSKLPLARVVVLARVASPASTDRTLQTGFLANLKSYFETHERIITYGDLIPASADEDLSRLFVDEAEENMPSPRSVTVVTWFRVVSVSISTENENGSDYADCALVDPKKTRIVQRGLEKSRLPSAIHRWQRYLQLNVAPIPNPLPDFDAFNNIRSLIEIGISSEAIHIGLPPTSILVNGPQGVGKSTSVEWICAVLGIHCFSISCYEVLSDTDAKTEGILRARWERAISCAPCILLLTHLDAIAKKREEGQENSLGPALSDLIRSSAGLVVVGTTPDTDRISDQIAACFRHEIRFEAPSEDQRHFILRYLTRKVYLSSEIDLKNLAKRTAALVAKDMVHLVSRAQTLMYDRILDIARAACVEVIDVECACPVVLAHDLEVATNEARKAFSDSIGAPKIPNVTWDDVGGLESVKSEIMDTIQLPLNHPELFRKGFKKRSGILFYGPPGTGKTLLAKAVATSFSLNFLSVKGPELLNMYIGESEANVRRVFQKARDARPCVVFFDELDSVAPKRGNQGDSGGVMDRIVSQLLAELDGMDSGEGVFVIGATNRPDLLDPALLRPGRFDKMIYLGVSSNHEQRVHILEALTRKFTLSEDVDLHAVVDRCSSTFTGADLYALTADAQLQAMLRVAQKVDNLIRAHDPPISIAYYFDKIAKSEAIAVVIRQADFIEALRGLRGSVSEQEMEYYSNVREIFEGSRGQASKGKAKA